MKNKIVSVYLNDDEVANHVEILKENNESVSAFFIKAAKEFINKENNIDEKIEQKVLEILKKKSNIDISEEENEKEDLEDEEILNRLNSMYDDI